MTRDPRTGLQQRYILDEILTINGGKHRIKPLNYDALTMLRNPLYVKMGQTISDNNTDQNKKILTEMERMNATRALASESGLPLNQIEELLRRLRKQDEPEDDDRFRDHRDDGDDDEDMGGGGGGGGGGSGGSGRSRPPSREPSPEPAGEPQGPWGPMDRYREGQPPPSAGSTALFRSNLEMQAQIDELREEARKSQKQTAMTQVIHQHHNINPMKEIIREFHQTMVPTPVPIPVQQDNSQLISTLQAAMSQNQDLGQFARQLGMSMSQLVEFMKGQMRQPQPEVASSSNQPRPPPPPPPPGAGIKRIADAPLQPPPQPQPLPQPVPIPIFTPRDRSRSAVAIPVPTTPQKSLTPPHCLFL